MITNFVDKFFGKLETVRPQVLFAMILIAAMTGLGAYIGHRMEAPEIVTASLGMGIPLEGLLAMKTLEKG